MTVHIAFDLDGNLGYDTFEIDEFVLDVDALIRAVGELELTPDEMPEHLALALHELSKWPWSRDA